MSGRLIRFLGFVNAIFGGMGLVQTCRADIQSCLIPDPCYGSEPVLNNPSSCVTFATPRCFNGYRVDSCASCVGEAVATGMVSIPGCNTQQSYGTCDGTSGSGSIGSGNIGGGTTTCSGGTYLSGSTCVNCPDGGSSVSGATAKTQCYKTSGSDSTGDFVYKSNCYYK